MKFDFTFISTDDGSKVTFQGGRSSLWEAQDLAAEWPDRKSNQYRQDFAWGYVGAKRAGKLADLGVDGMDQDEAIDYLADHYDLSVKDRTAPLAKRAG